MDDDSSIEPGGANSDKTKCKCFHCEEIFDIDPSWTYDSNCPSCEESIFCYVCHVCSYRNRWGASEPTFPNHPCDQCGQTQEDQEDEDRRMNHCSEEETRVSNGANFRAAKIKEPFPVYQNNIRLTYRALYGEARPGAPPVSEADALRMRDDDWEFVRPLVVDELGDDASSILTIQWCQQQMSIFERSWQSDNMAALERGTEEDWTGKAYTLGFPSLRVRIRSLRETQLEEGCMPVAPAVRIDDKAWCDTRTLGDDKKRVFDPLANFVTWEPLPENYDEDPREIYRTDGNKTLSLFEFLVWSARVGGFAGQEPNPKWNIEDCTPQAARYSTVEPIAYIPSDWVGRPKLFAEDKDRWHWLREQIRKGDFLDLSHLEESIEANMKLCSVCYGPPKEGRSDLILCECKTVYWCGEGCKEMAWDLHTLDHRVSHDAGVKRVCLNCGVKGGNEVLRCGRCQNAFFCNKDCQKTSWLMGHKKHCKKYDRGGRMEWSNVV